MSCDACFSLQSLIVHESCCCRVVVGLVVVLTPAGLTSKRNSKIVKFSLFVRLAPPPPTQTLPNFVQNAMIAGQHHQNQQQQQHQPHQFNSGGVPGAGGGGPFVSSAGVVNVHAGGQDALPPPRSMTM